MKEAEHKKGDILIEVKNFKRALTQRRVGALTWVGGDLKISAPERVGRSNRENRIALPHCGTAGRRRNGCGV